MGNKYQYSNLYFQIENLGIDWDGPVGIDNDSTVVVDEVESPLNSEERALDLFLATFFLMIRMITRKTLYVTSIYFVNLS